MFSFISRILLFFIALSVIRSLISVFMRAFRGQNGPRNTSSPNPPQSGSAGSEGSTMLHQDPVCGTYVAASSSLRKICNGQVFHFCSEECRNRYVA